MARLRCSDYGYECSFIAQGEDSSKVIEEFGKHTAKEHGIEYSKEALMHFLMRQ